MMRLNNGRGLVCSGALSLATLVAGAACSTSANRPSDPADRPPTYVYDVTYKPGVVVVDQATVGAALRDMSDDGATFTFDASASGLDGLKPGAVVLVWGLALRKITSVDTQGTTLVVQTDPAALTDAIQDGTIRWDQAIDFTTGGSGNFVVSGGGQVLDDAGGGDAGVVDDAAALDDAGALDGAPRRAGSHRPLTTLGFTVGLKPGEESLSGKIDGYDYKLTFKPSPGRLEVDAEVTKKTSGIELQISAKGFVNKFRTNADIAIAGGETTSASVQNTGLVGEIDLSFTAGKPTNAQSSEDVILKIPFSFKIPIPMPGGFPAFVQITANVAVVLALTSTNASAVGNYVVPFHGAAGFATAGGASEGNASGDMQSDPKIGDGTTTTSLGVSAMGVVVGFPHVGVGIGISELQTMAYVSEVVAAQMKTPGELGLKHCQAHSLSLSTNVGATASVFGLSFSSKPKQVYTKSVDVTLPTGVDCN